MKISINKSIRRLLIFIFYYTLFIQGVMSLLELPQIVLYIKDFLLLVCVFFHLYSKRKKVSNDFYILIAFLIICLFSFICNHILLFSFAVAIRKLFRGFIYFYLCKSYVRIKDVNRIMINCCKINVFNLLIIFLQRSFFGLHQDLSNGIFGTGYTNNHLSIFCLLILGYITYNFYISRLKLSSYIANVSIILAITLISELKILFFLIPFTVIIILWDKLLRSKKGIKLIGLGLIALLLFLYIFNVFYGAQIQYLISIDGLINYNDWGLATHSEVTRLNWFNYTLDNVFSNCFELFFGVGFGKVSGITFNQGSISMLQTLGYGSYCLSTIFVEVGLVGLIIFVYWWIRLLFDKFPTKELERFNFSNIILMIIFLVYSNFVMNDSCFIAFFLLAIPKIYKKEFIR